jgi:hypothetical protein
MSVDNFATHLKNAMRLEKFFNRTGIFHILVAVTVIYVG